MISFIGKFTADGRKARQIPDLPVQGKVKDPIISKETLPQRGTPR
jgi:hypothetical protein